GEEQRLPRAREIVEGALRFGERGEPPRRLVLELGFHLRGEAGDRRPVLLASQRPEQSKRGLEARRIERPRFLEHCPCAGVVAGFELELPDLREERRPSLGLT